MRSLAVVAALLLLAGAARASVIVGVNDDAGRNVAQSGWFYPAMGAEGVRVDTLVLRWDETAPSEIPDEPDVERALDLAAANGVTVELDLFPLHSQVFTGAWLIALNGDIAYGLAAGRQSTQGDAGGADAVHRPHTGDEAAVQLRQTFARISSGVRIDRESHEMFVREAERNT